MRLLIVSDTFPPDVNGVSRTLERFAVGLSERNHEVRIVTTSESPAGCQLSRDVVKSFRLPGYNAVRIGLATRAWFVRLIKEWQPEVIYAATETPLGIAAILAARAMKVPILSGFHTNFHSYARNYHLSLLQPLASAYLAAIHKMTALTVVPSLQSAALVRGMGVKQVSVIGRGVDADLFCPQVRDANLREQWGVSPDAPVALYVGRLALEKNLTLLKQSMDVFRASRPDCKCVIVGDGPCRAELERRNPAWHFAGNRSGQDLARHYASADVFIFPSLSETFGNVILEAIASGLVLVAYNQAAAAEHLTHETNALLAPPADEKPFIECVKSAAERWNDQGLRASARNKATDLTWDKIIQSLENTLLSSLKPLPAVSSKHLSPSTYLS